MYTRLLYDYLYLGGNADDTHRHQEAFICCFSFFDTCDIEWLHSESTVSSIDYSGLLHQPFCYQVLAVGLERRRLFQITKQNGVATSCWLILCQSNRTHDHSFVLDNQ
jgi:hypothetical protein